MRTWLRIIAGVALLGVVACAVMYRVAIARPVVRSATIAMPDWPRGAAPIRLVLLADLHVAGPDMPPSRVADIVAQVNGLKPDVVVFAGDFVSDKAVATRSYSAAQAIAPLARLKSTLGTVAVLGNHDHWRSADQVSAALKNAGIRLLDNAAIRIGPLSVGGVDDAFTGHERVAEAVAAMRRETGARVLLSHSPDVAPELPGDITLLLAGHTHCGQIVLPFFGPLVTASRFGRRYACGLINEGTRRVVVSAGLGTSELPLRLGAVPDMWLVKLGPVRSR